MGNKEEYIRQLDRLMTGMGRRFANARQGFSELPVSGPEFFHMRYLSVTGATNISALASGLSLNQSTVSNVVNALEDKGMVTREKDPADRRVTLVHLTDRGQEVLEEAAAQRFEHARRILGQLSEDDLAQLVRIFTKLRQRLTDNQ